MKILVCAIIIFLLSLDGFVAVFNITRKKKANFVEQETAALRERAAIMEWPEELARLERIGKANIPNAVLRRRGYTSRGNQLIARDAWAPAVVDIDKRIERIVSK